MKYKRGCWVTVNSGIYPGCYWVIKVKNITPVKPSLKGTQIIDYFFAALLVPASKVAYLPEGGFYEDSYLKTNSRITFATDKQIQKAITRLIPKRTNLRSFEFLTMILIYGET